MFRHAHIALLAAALAVGGLCGCDAAPGKPMSPASIPMRDDSGIYMVPVTVNGVATVDCIVDSGASDVNIPAEVFRKLLHAGTVKQDDYLGTDEYTLADGSTETGRTFRIRSLKVGNIVVHDVVASIGGTGSSALLGQSFLRRFTSWSLDNSHHALVLLGPELSAPTSAGTDATSTPPSKPAHPPLHPPAVASGDDSDGPSAATVAQIRGGDHVSRAARDPSDDHLTAQHSQSH